MGLKLYEIEAELDALDVLMDQWAAEHNGDLTDFPFALDMEKLEGERERKLLNIGTWIKNINAEAEAVKAEKNRLAQRQKALENKGERLKHFIAGHMSNDETFRDSRTMLSWRRSEAVIIDCPPEDLPADFIEWKSSARLADLKRYIKSGHEIEGVHIEERQNLQIK